MAINKNSTLSLCMIVKNEENTLGRCLASIKTLVDEIIIVDTGSTDSTKAVARRFTGKIYDFEWIDNFAAARNYAFSLATKELILWLDADDVILPKDRDILAGLLPTLPPEVDAVSMPYNLAADANGNVTSSLRRNRIVRQNKNFQWVGSVHEYLAVSGNIFNCGAAVTHKPLEHDAYRNLRIYENRLQKGEEFSPRDLFYFANELSDHRLYNRAIEYYQKFLSTKQGWVEDNIAACGKLADSFFNLKEYENQLKFIFKSFEFDTPRADFCCRLGFYYLAKEQFRQAAFWYKLATELEKPSGGWSLVSHDCWTWLPHIQLCVCYYRLGEYQLSHDHNEKAAEFIPNDPRIIQNREFLTKLLAEKQV